MAKAKAPMAHIEGVSEPVAEERATVEERAAAPQAAADQTPASAPKESARKAAKPRMQIADDPQPEPEEVPASEPAEQPADVADATLPDVARTQLKRLMAEHFHAVVGGVCGLVVAVLIFVVGFWQTLFVSLLAGVGVALGQYLDGDPKIVNLIRRLLSEGRGNN